MQISKRISERLGVLALSGRFDFNAHHDFRATCDELLQNPAVQAIEVDLNGVDYLDSSALGMLLLAREKAQAQGKTISLSRPKASVRQVLEIAQFGKLFELRG